MLAIGLPVCDVMERVIEPHFERVTYMRGSYTLREVIPAGSYTLREVIPAGSYTLREVIPANITGK